MFFRRRLVPKRKPPPRPLWLRWLLLAFVVYVVAMAVIPVDSKTRRTINHAADKIASNSTVDFGSYKEKIFPERGAGLRLSDRKQGIGMPAVCGQRVNVAYDTYLAQGNALPDKATRENPLIFTIGAQNIMPVFDRGVVGMRPGGVRSIVAPPLLSYGLEDYRRDDVPSGATVRFEIELLSAEPALPDPTVTPYRLSEIVQGTGAQILCGEETAIGVTLWDLRGKELYRTPDKERISLTPGKSQAMLGLEQGIIGMQQGGIRLLIIPPEYQKTMSGDAPAITFPLPENEMVMAEVRAYGPPLPQEP